MRRVVFFNPNTFEVEFITESGERYRTTIPEAHRELGKHKKFIENYERPPAILRMSPWFYISVVELVVLIACLVTHV
jgi:hypothetical protein